MKSLFKKIEKSGISIDEYNEGGKLCGYELSTYTDGGVNQIIFVDFRDTNRNPKNKTDFKYLFSKRVESIDIDEEIELNRQDKSYKENFTIQQSLTDFVNWKNDLVKLSNSL